MGTQTGLKLLGYFANICWRYLIFRYFIFTLGTSSMNGRRYDGGLWVVACFSGVILLLKYLRERRLVFLESTYLWMDLFCFLLFVFLGFWWLEYAQHDACVLLIILLISIINSNNKFFKMKNLILILIIFVYFCVLKINTLTVIQLSIKDNGNREKSFSARTV